MKNKFHVILFFLLLSLIPFTAKANFVCDIEMSSVVLPSLETAVNYLYETFDEAVLALTDVSNDEVIELKITDATIFAETQGQTSVLMGTLKQHAIASAIAPTITMWSPLSQSDFACTSECMTRGIIKNHNAPGLVTDAFTDATQDFNNGFQTWEELLALVSSTYRNADSSGLADARRILPSGMTTTTDVNQLATQIIALTNPLPASNLSNYGLETKGRVQHETLRGLKNIALSVTQRILSEQGGDVYPSYNLNSDPWFSEIVNSLGGTINDIDTAPGDAGDDAISGDGSLSMQVKARYANPNWHLDLHRKTITGGLRTLTAMNTVQLELKRQLNKTNEEILLLQAIHNGLEAERYYKKKIETFNNRTVIQ